MNGSSPQATAAGMRRRRRAGSSSATGILPVGSGGPLVAWLSRCLSAASVALLVFSTAVAATAPSAAPKTLTRFHDPVIISTGTLTSLSDRRTAYWRLYASVDGRFVPIPFQFDARDRHGDVVVDGAPDFTFDDNDELVFMAKDTGAQAAPALWPETSDAVLELEVQDPRHGERGWAYLLHFPDPPAAAASEPYVILDRAASQARSALYEVDYADGRDFYTGMRITPAAGGNGMNLLRQTRMSGFPTLHLFFTDVTLHFTEQNSIVAVEGIKNGAVRAIRRVRLSVDLGPLFPDLPNGTAYTYHYFSSSVTPTQFGVPWLALKTLRDFCFADAVDFAPQALPARYWDGANRDGIAWSAPDGRHVETTADHDWWVYSGAGGTMLHAFVVPSEWLQWGIVRGTVFRDGGAPGDGDTTAHTRDCLSADATYAAGYSLLHMTKLREARSYELLQTEVMLPRPYHPGDEEEPMAMLRTPLRTAVHRLR